MTALQAKATEYTQPFSEVESVKQPLQERENFAVAAVLGRRCDKMRHAQQMD
jgi:hypothetical protein